MLTVKSIRVSRFLELKANFNSPMSKSYKVTNAKYE